MVQRRVLLVLGTDGAIAGCLGDATSVVIADVDGQNISEWHPYEVRWNVRENEPDDDDQARVLDFVRARQVEAIVVERVDPRLRQSLNVIGVPVFERGQISARAAAVSASAVLDIVDGANGHWEHEAAREAADR